MEDRAVVWPRGLRWLAAALVGGAGIIAAQLGVRLALDAWDGGSRAPPPSVFTGAAIGVVLPLAIVSVLRFVFSARGRLPQSSEVESSMPWLLPLPAPGEAWQVRSGKRIEVEGPPLPQLEAPVARSARAARLFSAARWALHRRDLKALIFKYGVFPLLPFGVIFRAYQHITFGGWNAEYQLFGLAAYLNSAAVYWSVTVAHLVVIAGTLRVAAELCCNSAAWISPDGARAVRRGAEAFCRIVYYGGIPALLVLRFLA